MRNTRPFQPAKRLPTQSMNASKTQRRRRIAVRVAIAVLGLLAAMQAVPYGRDHSNPPVVQEPAWDAPRTRDLVVRSCFDCHSNQVRWPWYSHVAPVSWLVQRDVDDGRRHLNFSEWHQRQRKADDAAEEVAEGEMPLWTYLLAHPAARLDDAERRELIAGLERTLGDREGGRDRGRDDDES